MKQNCNSNKKDKSAKGTLFDLPFFTVSIQMSSSLKDLAELFKLNNNLPGAVIMDGKQCVGMISRDLCFETLGRPFGVELFFRRPISELLQKKGGQLLILPDNTPVREAVNKALSRQLIELYDPIIVSINAENNYRLIDMRTLLKAQSDILSTLVREVELLSIQDPLTGLLNRRGFFSQVKRHIDIARENDQNIAVMMVDIDLFKTINDIYGHQIGDLTIQNIACEFAHCVRDSDITGRYGGEEFIGMLFNVTANEAYTIAERFRQRIEGLVIQTEFYNINVTVSIGVCHINASSTGMESLLSRTDKALYEAKSAGRNRVVLWKNTSPFSHLVTKPTINQHPGEIPIRPNVSLFTETVESWMRALELRDSETEGHTKRVTTLSVKMAQLLNMSPDECENIRVGAILHDIGKIAIPDSILFKQGKLEPEEWVIMKKHPEFAYQFLSPIRLMQNVLDIPYGHHEHWDGSGYPQGIKGEAIPIAARIFTLVDVWDALTTDRCYRPAWSLDKTMQYILEQSGKLFDPNLVPIFINLIIQSTNRNENELLSKIVFDNSYNPI